MNNNNNNTITPIPQASIRSICNGQVITDLNTAIKELVENSLDAKATRISIMLHNYGADLIQVEDNGGGISPDNYITLPLKHYTSKLSTFEDLSQVTTSSFGFRGEALGSLCELASSFEVVTRTSKENIGTLLQYDRTGKLQSQKMEARSVGTTVRVANLFSPLPVRRNELLRTVKSQYNKAISTMYAYAVIHPNVRFTCQTTNGKSNGKRHTALSTQGGVKTSSRSAISSVFGVKFLKNLVPLKVQVGEQNDTNDNNSSTISGWVSKAGTGVGRSNNDRQFVFINQRPVDIPKVTRVMNTTWRLYEMKHKPAYILDLTLPSGSFDVNVTPDKRQVLLTDEKNILQSLENAIKKMWETNQYTYQVKSIQNHFLQSDDNVDGAKKSAANNNLENSSSSNNNNNINNSSSSSNSSGIDHTKKKEILPVPSSIATSSSSNNNNDNNNNNNDASFNKSQHVPKQPVLPPVATKNTTTTTSRILVPTPSSTAGISTTTTTTTKAPIVNITSKKNVVLIMILSLTMI